MLNKGVNNMEEKINYSVSIDIEKNGYKRYRYNYVKCWDEKEKKIIVILLNPSKATLTRNDKTLDILTETFLNKYGGMIVLNLFSLMSTMPIDLIDKERIYEDKNWKNVTCFLEKNIDKDFFIGWGKSFAGIKDKNIIKEAKDKKKIVESFFRNNKIKGNVFCFRSKYGRALHPSKYLDSWEYGDYFKR